ncbi:MAG: DUF2478 domain-containing protein [Thalassovita sp.]
MKLAYLEADKTGVVNTTLGAFAETLIARGVRVVGLTQTDTPRPKTHHCDMDVKVLPDGDVIRISQDLGAEARGCRLNTDALERAVAQVLPRLDDADVLIVNKFGKHEAEGRGFREVIAEAVARNIPVIVGTNGLNAQAFQTFCGGEAQCLPTQLPSLLNWLLQDRAAA